MKSEEITNSYRILDKSAARLVYTAGEPAEIEAFSVKLSNYAETLVKEYATVPAAISQLTQSLKKIETCIREQAWVCLSEYVHKELCNIPELK